MQCKKNETHKYYNVNRLLLKKLQYCAKYASFSASEHSKLFGEQQQHIFQEEKQKTEYA